MAGALWGGHAARGEKALGDAVFERMEGDDGEPAPRLEEMLGGAQAPRKLEQLLIEIETERLKGSGRRMYLIFVRSAYRSFHQLG